MRVKPGTPTFGTSGGGSPVAPRRIKRKVNKPSPVTTPQSSQSGKQSLWHKPCPRTSHVTAPVRQHQAIMKRNLDEKMGLATSQPEIEVDDSPFP